MLSSAPRRRRRGGAASGGELVDLSIAEAHGRPDALGQALTAGAIIDSGPPALWCARPATGPRVIAAGARLADRVSLMVGACPARVRWGIEVARRAREQAGLDPDGLTIGAYVSCVAHPDRAVARGLLRGSMGTLIRFSGMGPGASAGLSAQQTARLAELARRYSIRQHAMGSADHSTALGDDLIDELAVAGPSEYCVERLSELAQLGLQSLVIAGHSRDADPALLEETSQRFTEEVLPQLHRFGPQPSPAAR